MFVYSDPVGVQVIRVDSSRGYLLAGVVHALLSDKIFLHVPALMSIELLYIAIILQFLSVICYL